MVGGPRRRRERSAAKAGESVWTRVGSSRRSSKESYRKHRSRSCLAGSSLNSMPRSRSINLEMQARPEFINPAGLIHGGMLAAMLDETLSPALAATLGPGEFAPTLEIKVNFITPAKSVECWAPVGS